MILYKYQLKKCGETIVTKFQERFKELRVSQNIKQIDIANQLGITPQAVSNYAAGREPDYDTLISLANLLGVSVDYLIGATNSRNEQTENFCNKTGLSDEAVDKLISIGECYPHGECLESEVLNKIICSPLFCEFVSTFDRLINPFYIHVSEELLFDSELANDYVSNSYNQTTQDYDIDKNLKFILAALEKQSADALIQLATSIRKSQKVTKSEIKKVLQALETDDYGGL